MQSEKPFRKILVPVDGSLPSLVAQELTAFVAKKLNSQVTVLHVIAHEFMGPPAKHVHPPVGVTYHTGPVIYRHAPAPIAAAFPEAVASEIKNWYHQKGAKVADDAVALFNGEGIPTERKLVEHADPADTIIEEARRGNCDVIVMGHSGEEEQEAHLGSVVKKVSRHSETPVLIARRKRDISKMLIPVDGSENALKALGYAVLLARKTDAEMTLLHVQEPGLFKLRPDVTKEIGDRVLSYAVEQVEGVEVERKLETGDPAKVITQTAEKGDYDLIVIGSRGLGAIGRFLLGSVSDHVTHHAGCSVLIVK